MVVTCLFRYQQQEDIDLLDMCSFLDSRTKSLPYLTDSKRAKLQDKICKMLVECDTTAADDTSTTSIPVPDITQSRSSNLLDDIFQKKKCVHLPA